MLRYERNFLLLDIASDTHDPGRIGRRNRYPIVDGLFLCSGIRSDQRRGSYRSKMKEITGTIVDDLRNNLFGPPTAETLLDLATLNIQRGRDHSVAGFNAVRQAYGLPTIIISFSKCMLATAQGKVQTLYATVDDVDPWVGCVIENHVGGAAVGATTLSILRDQFRRTSSEDRCWYLWAGDLGEDLVEVKSTLLATLFVEILY